MPHTEVEIILANGRSVDFSYIVQAGDRISVYPMFESLDITPLLRLREKPLRDPRFVVDANLGQLARYLRLLGFDAIYRNDYTDREVAEIASRDKRIVLTRDRALLQHKIITHGYFIRAVKPREQVREILARLDLYRALHPFTRCLRCNGELEEVEKQAVLERLEPKTRLHYDRFRQCKTCGQIVLERQPLRPHGKAVRVSRDAAANGIITATGSGGACTSLSRPIRGVLV